MVTRVVTWEKPQANEGFMKSLASDLDACGGLTSRVHDAQVERNLGAEWKNRGHAAKDFDRTLMDGLVQARRERKMASERNVG